MSVLNTDEIINIYSKIIQIISTLPNKKKANNIIKMLDTLAQRLLNAPASTRTNFHGAYKGGLVQHLLQTYYVALELQKTYRSVGYTIDWTDEQLKVTCLLHDIGKIGQIDLDIQNQDLYIPTNSQWHNSKGIMYQSNQNIRKINHAQQSLYIIQRFNIDLSFNQYYGILLHNGAIDETVKPYFSNYGNVPDHNFALFIHQADVIACKVKKQEFLK